MNGLRNLVEQLGPRRLTVMGAVAALLLLGLAWLALREPAPEMGFLYSDLDPAAAQAITEKLTAQNIPYKLSPDGSSIMAPQEKLAELRMSMAAEQLGGKIGYEVLDSEEPFGVSASRAKLNETRAIEGELARSIESLANVRGARVHIVMPERAVFSSESRKATAAVTVKTSGRLPEEAVQAIRYLVSSSVPELAPESVSIVDQTGALLARAGEAGAAGGGGADERQAEIEERLRAQIEALLEPIVGAGKVRAQVAAVINRDQTREEANIVDPDKQAVAHQITVEAADQNSENDAGAKAASVAAQLPEAEAQGGAPGDSRRSARNETSEDTTYENSRTHTVTIRAPGKVDRLTVAVMIDGSAGAMPPAQIQRLTRLVENAVGFDEERGDSVVVESMKFATPAEVEAAPASWQSMLPSDDALTVLKLILIAAVGLLALRMLRPQATMRTVEATRGALPRVLAPDGTEVPLLTMQKSEEEMAAAALEGGGEAAPMLEAARPRRVPASELVPSAEMASLDHDIALAQVDGRIKLSALRRIGHTITSSPAEATSVIRQWMNA